MGFSLVTSTLTHLGCSACGKELPSEQLIGLCPDCGKPLLARYDLKTAGKTLTKRKLAHRRADLWRYEEVLPVRDPAKRIMLGEGFTPLVGGRLGERIGCARTLIKDESFNPTASFKARGLCLAVSRAWELGAPAVAIPSAGNAGSATAAYAAAAGIKAHVFVPADVPLPFQVEARAYGAEVTLVDGLITDCGRKVRDGVERHGWFDVSTLKEPYRIEGKKTMGYELAEQLGWTLPDVVIYPTGGGTGLIGMWKAFDEMERMGLIDSKRPRMVSVQSAGCAPMVRAFHEGSEHAEPWQGAKTIADGLRVPAAIGDFLILRALRESNGTAVAVDDDDMIESATLMASSSGVFPGPEGAACLAAQIRLLRDGWIDPDESVVLFNTGTALKQI
ncbi:MAG TPA: threonine synthase, partial [Gammaproteobacteria bacterium]|nr:threonine synthase [Gammaproteobacteria bacterium]